MGQRSRWAAAVRCSLVLLLVGAGACTPAVGGSTGPAQSSPPTASPGRTGSVAPPPSGPVGFPPEAQQQAMAAAAQQGRSPAGGAAVLVRWGDGEVPHLLWQAEESGDICMAQATTGASTVTTCEEASAVLAAPSPGIRRILGAALNVAQDGFNSVLLASGETLDEFSCGAKAFGAHRVLTTQIGGVTRTIYSVTVPRTLGGTYHATVQRDGHEVVENVRISAEGEVQC